MDLHSGTPYWPLLHGLRTVVPPLAEHGMCDVAIIGSGITGSLLAWTLSREGARVILLDRRDLTQGSTAASTALLQYELDIPLYKLERSIGVERARRAYQIGVEAIRLLEDIGDQIGSAVEPLPSLYFVEDAKTAELEIEIRARRRADLKVDWLDSRSLRDDWGIRAAAAIRSEVAAQLDPYDYSHRLLAAAIESRAIVCDRTTVVDAVYNDGQCVLCTDRGATVVADFVVHATGYEAANRLPTGLVDLSSTYAVVSEPTTPPRNRCIMWELADPYVYLRWSNDRLMWGGEDVPFENERLRDALIMRKSRVLVDRATALLPDVPIEPAFAWAGTFGQTRDGLGYIGPLPGLPHELHALGFGGNGITFSAVATWLIADHIAGRRNPDASLFAFDRALEVK